MAIKWKIIIRFSCISQIKTLFRVICVNVMFLLCAKWLEIEN